MRRYLIFVYCIGLTLLLQSCSGLQQTQDSARANSFFEVNAFLSDAVAPIATDVRYFSNDNFLGVAVDGYNAAKIYISLEAALALAAIQIELAERGLGLKVFDAYRPQRAVDHFVRWGMDLDDQAMKQQYYPRVDKAVLFDEGYIAERSGHSRGSTVDLTLVDLASGEEIDMGSPWDYFDPISWPTSLEVSLPQKTNREILREIMLRHGFMPISTEWWHFYLEDEPYPDTYFDFPVN